MRILFLPQTTIQGAASRARIYQYLSVSENVPFCWKVWPGTSIKLDSLFLQKPNFLNKIRWFAAKLWIRMCAVLVAPFFDCVVLQRPTLPNLFPIPDLLLTIFAQKLVYDFDDAIFSPRKSPRGIKRFLFDKQSLQRVIKRCDRLVVSNRYLADKAAVYNSDIRIIPTSIMLEDYPNEPPFRTNDPLVIGWIGSASTKEYLSLILPALSELYRKLPFVLKIVGLESLPAQSFPIQFESYKVEKEVAMVTSFDIGIMPLLENSWTCGKGGYKILQYMAGWVSCIASPVGVNTDIIEDGVNGFLAASDQEWILKLQILMTNKGLRDTFAKAGRRSVKERYSIRDNLPEWINAISNF